MIYLSALFCKVPSVLQCYWLGDRKGIRSIKTLLGYWHGG